MSSQQEEHMHPKSQQLGVTLIEMAIVVAISAIVMSTVSPSFHGFIDNRRVDAVASTLHTDIQFVRQEAVLRNQPVRLSFHTEAWGACYVVHTGARADCRCAATGGATCEGTARQIKTVTLLAAEAVGLVANVGSILFDPLHGTSTPTGTLKVASRSGRAVHHVVNVMGRVRSCSPQGVAAAVPGYRIC
jgi:type IV fimbrial biogenesis protein FimT